MSGLENFLRVVGYTLIQTIYKTKTRQFVLYMVIGNLAICYAYSQP